MRYCVSRKHVGVPRRTSREKRDSPSPNCRAACDDSCGASCRWSPTSTWSRVDVVTVGNGGCGALHPLPFAHMYVRDCGTPAVRSSPGAPGTKARPLARPRPSERA
eukprot:6691654-Prymnesium_polylepis.2